MSGMLSDIPEPLHTTHPAERVFSYSSSKQNRLSPDEFVETPPAKRSLSLLSIIIHCYLVQVVHHTRTAHPLAVFIIFQIGRRPTVDPSEQRLQPKVIAC
jgi:hypothetical protein